MSRKQRAPNFTPERASQILAEADLFGDFPTCNRWNIGRTTLYAYRNRLQEDSELADLFILKKRILLMGWQDDAAKTLKIGLNSLRQMLELQDLPDDLGKYKTKGEAGEIHAVAGALKIVGELKIASDALSEPNEHTVDIEGQAVKAHQG